LREQLRKAFLAVGLSIANPWAGTRERIAKLVHELIEAGWKSNDFAILLNWATEHREGPSSDAVRAACHTYHLVIGCEEGTDWWADVERLVADLDSSPEEMLIRNAREDDWHRFQRDQVRACQVAARFLEY
jgi:hypothetical protein